MENIYLIDFGYEYRLYDICYDEDTHKWRFFDFLKETVRWREFDSMEDAIKFLENYEAHGIIKSFKRLK